MPHPTPDLSQIRTDYLRDLRGLLDSADITPDSDNFVRGTALASAVEGLYQHQRYLYRQIFPDSADTSELERHAASRSVFRKAATRASGPATFSGTPGAPIAAGLVIALLDGRRYQVVTAGAIAVGGSAVLTVQAVDAGEAGNVPAGWIGTLQAPPLGVASQVVLGAISGGTDVESDAALLGRLLDRIRRPPAGGNKYDYRRWALEVPGVTAAYVYPLRRGLGTVDIVITSGDGPPSVELINAVTAHIDDVRPVRATGFRVIGPDILTVDVHLKLSLASGYTIAGIAPAVTAALGEVFAPLAPGDVLVRSYLETVASNLPGVQDRLLLSPATNVVPVADTSTIQWCRLGTVTLEAM